MKRAGISSLSYKPLRPVRGAVLFVLFPILFCGCFDSQNSRAKQIGANGITSLSRFFLRSQNTQEQAVAEAVSDTGSRYFLPTGISASAEFAQDAAESEIALPGFFGSNASTDGNLIHAGVPGGKTPATAGRGRALTSADLSILNSSFSQLFTSVFNQNRNNESSQAAKEDLPNPFTEERVKREASSSKSSADTSATKSDTAANAESKNPESSAEKSAADSAPQASTGGGVRWEKDFVILGDFDGSGRLSARPAQRSGEATFVSDDGERGFSLYANYAALNRKSSFYIDDMDGDGITDLLITSSASVFGGVLLGDGNGGYRIAEKFVTGYQAVIPGAGPFQGGMREILTVNPNTGELKRYGPADDFRSPQSQFLSLLPDFLLHLVAPDTARDFVLVGQLGGSQQILGWDDDVLRPTSDSLGVTPLSLSGSFGANSLQVYQVGNYASVVLSGQGKLYNVANLRVSPQIYLVLGDIYRQGFVDVGVGTLSYFTPK
jgi:hypothetical protein